MAAQETVHDDSTKDNADNADNTGNKEKSPKKNRKRTRATRSSGPAPVVSPPLFSVMRDRETDWTTHYCNNFVQQLIFF